MNPESRALPAGGPGLAGTSGRTSGPFVVMGVSGSGKSSVAAALAEKTGGVFLEADDMHTAASKARMAAGIPLEDDDRSLWIDQLHSRLLGLSTSPAPVFLACSALKRTYRKRLACGLPGLRFLYLKGSRELIRPRLEARRDHFMPPALLESQFAALEEPEPGEAVTVSIEPPFSEVVDALLKALHYENGQD